jgi:hypothetical protein
MCRITPVLLHNTPTTQVLSRKRIGPLGFRYDDP